MRSHRSQENQNAHLQGNLVQLFAPALSSLNHAEQDVRVHGALVGFVQDHHGVALQQGVTDGLAQEHPIGHELQLGLRGGDVLEAHRVPNLERSLGQFTVNRRDRRNDLGKSLCLTSQIHAMSFMGFCMLTKRRAYQFAELGPLLLRHPSCQRDRSDPARLSDGNDALPPDAGLIQILGDLSGLPRASLP